MFIFYHGIIAYFITALYSLTYWYCFIVKIKSHVISFSERFYRPDESLFHVKIIFHPNKLLLMSQDIAVSVDTNSIALQPELEILCFRG